MADTKITAARDTVELLPNGRLRAMRQYEYTVDGMGPFLHEIAKAEDSADALLAAIALTRKTLESVT